MDWLGRRIGAYVSRGDGCLCILEHECARPDDPWLTKYEHPPIMFLDDRAFLAATSTRTTPREIIRRVNCAATAWGLVGAIDKAPPQHAIDEGSGVISREAIEAVGYNADGVIVAAFDWEGCLLWLADR